MRLLRFGICALVVFAVAAHGGVEDWARAVLETGAEFLFLAWALWVYFTHQEQIVFSPLVPPLAALLLIVCGQLFFHGTASSYGTRIELLLLVSDLILLFLAVQSFRTLQDCRHSPAAHFQWEALLVPRDALRWDSIWALREPQSLRRIRRISSIARPRSPRPG